MVCHVNEHGWSCIHYCAVGRNQLEMMKMFLEVAPEEMDRPVNMGMIGLKFSFVASGVCFHSSDYE